MTTPTITAVLNGYRRPDNIKLQLDALRAQTVQPAEIMLWQNAPGVHNNNPTSYGDDVRAASASVNFGVWARFAYALNARSTYVCVFDDDTIPGSTWFENCLATMAKREALLGTIGILYSDPRPPSSTECSYYETQVKIGWYDSGNRDVPIDVDLVGHAWFFKRKWLSTFWRELPDTDMNLCGEDMHFSYMLQKYLGVPTVVPPHPHDKREMWGSTMGEMGNDAASLWVSDALDASGRPFRSSMNEFFVQQRRKGWRLVNER